MNKNIIIFIESILASIAFLFLPYFLLPEGSYLSKSIPIFGYILPKTGLAWVFFILGIIFLLNAIFYGLKLKKCSCKEGKN